MFVSEISLDRFLLKYNVMYENMKKKKPNKQTNNNFNIIIERIPLPLSEG